MVEVERDGNTRPRDEGPRRGRGHLHTANVLQVGRVELQEDARTLRFGRVEHAADHLDVRDVEAGHGVPAALRGGQQFMPAGQRHLRPLRVWDVRGERPQPGLVRAERNRPACYARPAAGGRTALFSAA